VRNDHVLVRLVAETKASVAGVGQHFTAEILALREYKFLE
jgi:hypothetical protein